MSNFERQCSVSMHRNGPRMSYALLWGHIFFLSLFLSTIKNIDIRGHFTSAFLPLPCVLLCLGSFQWSAWHSHMGAFSNHLAKQCASDTPTGWVTFIGGEINYCLSVLLVSYCFSGLWPMTNEGTWQQKAHGPPKLGMNILWTPHILPTAYLLT